MNWINDGSETLGTNPALKTQFFFGHFHYRSTVNFQQAIDQINLQQKKTHETDTIDKYFVEK